MLSAIGSSTFTSPVVTGASTAGLESQLDKCKTQLADWVSCPSHVTPEGKAKIEEISNKISELEQRIKTTDAARRSNNPTLTNTNTSSDINKDSTTSALSLSNQLGDTALLASTPPSGAIGSLLNVFA